ncbi:MAG: LysM repeat protein [Myxococcota bacterium]|jgi:LysM repeat protein
MSEGLAFNEDVSRSGGGLGATEKIARVLEASGIDAPASLYDEALTYARDGKYAAAHERLRMLLCLDPDDADASLLLGRVLASMGRWQESLSYIDAAQTHGAILPPGLREHVEAGLRRELAAEEERRARIATRERTEIQNLRREAKRLRSDNAALDAQVDDLQKRVRIWSSVTALVAGSASALLLATLLFGDSPDSNIDEVVSPEDAITDITPDAGGDPEAAPPTPEAELIRAPVAEPAPGQVEPEYPLNYTVRGGDTLGKIAVRFYGRASLHAHIQKANSLDGTSLRVGQRLIIPEPPE